MKIRKEVTHKYHIPAEEIEELLREVVQAPDTYQYRDLDTFITENGGLVVEFVEEKEI